MTEARLIIWRN